MSENGYWSSIMEFFGFKDNEENTTSSERASDKELNSRSRDEEGKVINLSRTEDVKLVVHNPNSFEGVREIVDDLKKTRAVILNLEGRNKELSRRLIDFLSGSVYALNGSTQKLGSEVFIFTPPGMDVDARAIESAIQGEFTNEE